MGKITISARVEVQEWVDFHYFVNMMKPTMTASERIRQLIVADIKRGRKKEARG